MSRYTSEVKLLRKQAVSCTEKATQNGALVPVPTSTTIVEDHGIPFLVHIGALQERKNRDLGIARSQQPLNPFRHPDPDLVVREVPPNHICLLNKFNVIRHHLLIVTQAFEPQEAELNLDDFNALLGCMHEFDGLGFYNCGTVAGASQAHKHLQLVPLPLGDGPNPTPIDAVIGQSADVGVLSTIPALSFNHALFRLDGSPFGARRAGELHQLYLRACAAVGVFDESRPYNLLITRRWMLLVPRSREFWRTVSINALGFAGSLLVRNREEFEQLRTMGPLAALKSVSTQEFDV